MASSARSAPHEEVNVVRSLPEAPLSERSPKAQRRTLPTDTGPKVVLHTIQCSPGLTLEDLQQELLREHVARSVSLKRLRGYIERCIRAGLIEVVLGDDGQARFRLAQDLSWLEKPRETPHSTPTTKSARGTKYTVVSLFSGAMGLDIGLHATGRFRLLACIEKEPAFCQTIRLNQEAGRLPGDLNIVQSDIADVDPLKLLEDLRLKPGEVDLIVGGPPCQPFSKARQRANVQDARSTLPLQFRRFVEAMQPKFFLMENVPGLLTAALKPGAQPGSLMRAFEEGLGGSYRMDTFVVDAASYGTPQFRERAIVIGNRCDAHLAFPEPTHGPMDERKFDAPLDVLLPPLKPWVTLRDVLRDLQDPAPVIIDFSPRRKRFLKFIPPGSNWRSLPPELQRESFGKAWREDERPRAGWWRRLSFDAPSPTLVTMPCHASTSLCHPTETRALSLREYARIQEFPDEWAFHGTKAQRYAQIGNAVPVRLGRVAGEVIAEALDRVGAAP